VRVQQRPVQHGDRGRVQVLRVVHHQQRAGPVQLRPELLGHPRDRVDATGGLGGEPLVHQERTQRQRRRRGGAAQHHRGDAQRDVVPGDRVEHGAAAGPGVAVDHDAGTALDPAGRPIERLVMHEDHARTPWGRRQHRDTTGDPCCASTLDAPRTW
jgi:hypothetical protein